MKVSPIVIVVLTLSSLLVSFTILMQPLGRCDPESPPTYFDIEGAHIVSEGAYFRFWIFNNNSFPVNVTVNGADILNIPSKRWADYDVIAPNINVPYEQVTYKFSITSYYVQTTNYSFTVLVLNSGFVQIFNLAPPIFDLAVPMLVTMLVIMLEIIAAMVLALVAVVIVRWRRGKKKT
jgi:hypothetical protein